MTNEEILEGNKLIASFMGYTLSYYSGEFDMVGVNGKMKSLESWAKYHRDWNWLMSVVEKIYKLSGENKPYYGITFIMHNDTFRFGTDNSNENGLNMHMTKIGEPFMTATYLAIVEFIKWYNIQEKS